ncbi:MAG: DinB family protein [Phycisphaerales bacterium]|nr:DinB family protein [Phycisphaerales bacterium]
MNLLDRLLRHDAWTTGQLLTICESLEAADLDYDFDIGHRSLRRTFDHIIWNMEVWSALMAGAEIDRNRDCDVTALRSRLNTAAKQLAQVARNVAKNNTWDETWLDHLDNPPSRKSYGTAIAHVLTHSMHHRAQILHMLRRAGVTPPEGDVFSWERESGEKAAQ